MLLKWPSAIGWSFVPDDDKLYTDMVWGFSYFLRWTELYNPIRQSMAEMQNSLSWGIFYVHDELSSVSTVNLMKGMPTKSDLRFHKIASSSAQVMEAVSPEDEAAELKDLDLGADIGSPAKPRGEPHPRRFTAAKYSAPNFAACQAFHTKRNIIYSPLFWEILRSGTKKQPVVSMKMSIVAVSVCKCSYKISTVSQQWQAAETFIYTCTVFVGFFKKLLFTCNRVSNQIPPLQTKPELTTLPAVVLQPAWAASLLQWCLLCAFQWPCKIVKF